MDRIERRGEGIALSALQDLSGPTLDAFTKGEFEKQCRGCSFVSRLMRDAAYSVGGFATASGATYQAFGSSETVSKTELLERERYGQTYEAIQAAIQRGCHNLIFQLRSLIGHTIRSMGAGEVRRRAFDYNTVCDTVRYWQVRTGWDDWAVLVPQHFWREVDYRIPVRGVELVPVPGEIVGEMMYVAPKDFIKVCFHGERAIGMQCRNDVATSNVLLQGEMVVAFNTAQPNRRFASHDRNFINYRNVPWLTLAPDGPEIPDIGPLLSGIGREATAALLATAEKFQ
jgi:hypothetical protein